MPRPEPDERERVGLPRAWHAVLGLNFLVYAIWGWGCYSHHQIDTYQSSYVAFAIARGQLPYLDFAYYFGPLAVLLEGALLGLTGPSLGALYFVGILTIAATLVALEALAVELKLPPDARAVTQLLFLNGFAFNNAHSVRLFNYVMPYSPASTHAVLFLLVGFCFVLRWLRCRRPTEALGWGLAAAGIALNRPDLGLAFAFCSLLLALRCGPLAVRGAGGLRLADGRRQALALVAGFVLPLALVYGYLASRVGVSRLLFDNLLWMGHHPDHNPHQEFIFGDLTTLGPTLAVAAVHLGAWLLLGLVPAGWRPWLLPFLVLGCGLLPPGLAMSDLPVLLLILLLASSPKTAPECFLAALSGLLLARILLRCYLNSYLFFLGVPALLLVVAWSWRAAGLVEARQGQKPPVPSSSSMGKASSQRALLLGTMILLCGRYAYLNARSFLVQTLPLSGPCGTVLAPSSPSTRALAQLLPALRKQGVQGKTVLVLPEGALINVLTGSQHPLYHPTVLPHAVSACGEDTLLEQIVAARPDFIVLLHRATPEFLGSGRFGVDYAGSIVGWVESQYHLQGRYGPPPFQPPGHEAGGALLYSRLP